MDNGDFNKLLQASAELAEHFPDGLIYIGGIAVYLHAINEAKTQALAETTHDGDLYISLAEMSSLREEEELTSNRRLRKHQLIKRGFEFDIYTERQSNLRVPYDQVFAHSNTYDTYKVASLEHLLILKTAAYEDRRGSNKGEKDARDLIRIAAILDAKGKQVNPELVLCYLLDDTIDLLDQIAKGPAPSSLANGNAKLAKNYRRAMSNMVDTLRVADQDNTPQSNKAPNRKSMRSH